jgi:hypothetical protein
VILADSEFRGEEARTVYQRTVDPDPLPGENTTAASAATGVRRDPR